MTKIGLTRDGSGWLPDRRTHRLENAMRDLIDFVRGRLDEDEKYAQEALAARDRGAWYSPTDLDGLDAREALHIITYGPARVLREVEAKRRIFEEHRPARPKARPSMEPHCLSCTTAQAWDGKAAEANCVTLRLLALPFDDHPDYDERWRP